MIRFFLLGGRWPKTPWQALCALGGSFLLAGLLYGLLFPLWTTYPIVGDVVVGGLGITGVGLVLAGVARRRRTKPDGSVV